MTILEKGRYRIQTIARFNGNGIEELPVSEGLSIEMIDFLTETYIVICEIDYNDHEESAGIIGDVHGRLLNIPDSDFKLFKALYKVAKELVEIANVKYES